MHKHQLTTLSCVCSAGGTQRLPRTISRSRAKELVFTGRAVGAEEAHELGLLDYALPAESALEEGLEVARNIAQVPEYFF